MLLKNASRKTTQQLFYIILLVIIALVKLIIEEKNIIDSDNFPCIFNFYFSQLFNNNYLIFKIGTFILYILNAILLTYILKKHKLIELHKYYPSFFYLLFCLFIIKTSLFIPLLINSIILIFLISPLFLISEKNYTQKKGFIFGLFCGFITLIYAPFIFFFLLIYLIFILNGIYAWRNYIIPLLGLVLSYIYFLSFLYLIDYENYLSLFSFYLNQAAIIFLQINFSNYFQAISYFSFFIFYLLFFYLLLSKAPTMNIFTRKKFYFLLLYSFFSLIFTFIFTECKLLGFVLFITMLSIMGGICESFIKKRYLYNILILIFLLSLLADYFLLLYA